MKWAALGLVAVGGVIGLAVAGATTTVVEKTGTNEFCLACHEMSWPQETYTQQAHYKNASGVRAPCITCHVDSHPWTDYLWGKATAGAKDVWGHFTGKLSTREEYDAKREEMSEQVWAYLERTDSGTCRSCHDEAAMALEKQSPAAQFAHPQAQAANLTCISCHKGIGHGPVGDEAAAAAHRPAKEMADLAGELTDVLGSGK
ncbi:NapC/NirT family cytochrome c [Afifella sp. JA880]|uniref:NapC/NirT family cytochrome c n=1 Tax=Afifella sp. JA880 TaxID=2975280 RepID=UPI0021BA7301|nr:NapC/NirT family cytochrome c [Afifella sp. JA880]MCT8266251.1 NapC/NirT family cytochrome c [Afifella sp. JA880]